MKISRDDNIVELTSPPQFNYGEKVRSLKTVRNDGTFNGREIGDILVKKGDIGYVTSIGTFLQQFYIYAVEFVEHGYKVGMRGKEMESLEKNPDYIEDSVDKSGDKDEGHAHPDDERKTGTEKS